jgi:hypothetical protein
MGGREESWIGAIAATLGPVLIAGVSERSLGQALSVGSLVGLATLSTAIWRFLPARIVGSVGGTLGSMGGYWVLVETGDGTGQAGFVLVVVLCSLLLFSASGLLDQMVNAPGR